MQVKQTISLPDCIAKMRITLDGYTKDIYMTTEQVLQDNSLQKEPVFFEEFGAKLCALRKIQELKLEDIARKIKLSERTLLSIEDGRQIDLPHTVYAKGFVRTYARFLGMPEEEIAEGLSLIFPVEEDEKTIPLHILKPHKKSALISTIAFLLLLAILAVSGWYIYSNIISPSAKQPDTPTTQPAQLDSQADVQANIVLSETEKERDLDTTEPKQTNNIATATPDSADSADSELKETEGTQNSNSDVEGSIYFQSGLGVTKKSETQEQTSAIVPSKKHRVVITATKECWIKATSDSRDERPFNLPVNQSGVFTFDKFLKLRLGNAAGVKIRYNGRDFPIVAGTSNTIDLVFPPSNN